MDTSDVVIFFRNGDKRTIRIDKVNADGFIKTFDLKGNQEPAQQLVFHYNDETIIIYTQDVRSIDIKR